MKGLIPRRGLGLDLFDGLDNFFRPWFPEEYEMKTDVKEEGDKYKLEVELPGFDKKDVSLVIEDGYLKVSAARNEETESEEKGKYVRRERKYGSVSRSFYVGDIKEEDVKANFNNGLLTLVFPKEPPEKLENKKRIQIE